MGGIRQSPPPEPDDRKDVFPSVGFEHGGPVFQALFIHPFSNLSSNLGINFARRKPLWARMSKLFGNAHFADASSRGRSAYTANDSLRIPRPVALNTHRAHSSNKSMMLRTIASNAVRSTSGVYSIASPLRNSVKFTRAFPRAAICDATKTAPENRLRRPIDALQR